MSINKGVSNTNHGAFRLQERTNMFRDEQRKLTKNASRYGKAWENMAYGPLRNYVRSKSRNKRTRYYDGYVFIFQRTSSSLITMFPVPSQILTDQKNYEKNHMKKEEDIIC